MNGKVYRSRSQRRLRRFQRFGRDFLIVFFVHLIFFTLGSCDRPQGQRSNAVQSATRP